MADLLRQKIGYRPLIILFIYLLSVTYVQASWYQATGIANIYKGNVEKARKAAIKDAVKDALLFAGANVTSAQQVTNGLLTQDMFEVRASGVVNDILILSEEINDDRLTIHLRADVFASDRQCVSAHYKKSLAFAQLQLTNQAQAKVGELYELNKSVGKRLYRQLKNDSMQLDSRQYIEHAIAINSESLIQGHDTLATTISEVAKQSDAQYVLTGLIEDISLEQEQASLWQTPVRYFDMQLFIFDGYTGEKMTHFNYSSEAKWDFNLRTAVDVNSRRFWQSSYGESITQQISKAFADVENYMQCLGAQAKIVDINGYHLRFNIGSDNGLKVGDSFKILHQSSFSDKQGKIRPQFIISPYEVVVEQVYRQSATAKSPTEQLLGNVQIGDIVKPDNFAFD